MIAEIAKQEIIAKCREVLRLPELMAPLLMMKCWPRWLGVAQGIHCPCSRATLHRSILEGLQYLSNEGNLPDRIETIIEGLIVGGDLLELHDVGVIDPEAKGTWVFAAPPSYVSRANGEIFLFGVVPDQDVFLPEPLASRICVEGAGAGDQAGAR